MGHSWSRAFPIARRCLLSRCRLLRSRLRHNGSKHIQEPWFVARWVLDPGESEKSRALPVRRVGQQNWFGEPSSNFCDIFHRFRHFHEFCQFSGVSETRSAMVPIQKRYSILWNISQGGHQRRHCFSNDRQERSRPGNRGLRDRLSQYHA